MRNLVLAALLGTFMLVALTEGYRVPPRYRYRYRLPYRRPYRYRSGWHSLAEDESTDVVATARRHSSLQELLLTQLNDRLGKLEAEVDTLTTRQNAQSQDVAASTYVRWGRSDCPGSAELVYAGVMGGADSRGTGASNTVLCLPLDPVFGKLTKSRYYADLWGAEFQTHSSRPTINNMDPHCAVCRVGRATSIMVPAKNRCEEGWMLEYSGQLMGSYPPHKGGHDFLCMDSHPQSRMGGNLDQEGLLLYLTFANCAGTSLPCPPYEHDRLITCAVCSK